MPRGAVRLLRQIPVAWFALLLAAPAAAQLAPVPQLAPGTQVEITAETLVREKSGLVHALGDARVKAGDLLVSAPELTYDPDTHLLSTVGRTTVRDGLYVLRAHTARLDLATGEGTFEQVELYQKKQLVPFETLLAADDLQVPGVNGLVVTARSIHRLPTGEMVAQDPRVTTCDCGDREKPSWFFAASSATVVPNESVSLVFPRLELPRVPAPPLPFPYLSLPLAKRKSGLLMPVLAYTASRGAQVELPLYLVLGPSYDATIAPAWFTGPFGERPPAFKGPRLGLEFRDAPAMGHAGHISTAYAYDLAKRELTAEQRLSGQQELQNRWALQLTHADTWSDHLANLVDLSLVSDRRWVSDFSDNVLVQGQQVTRSVGWVNAREGAALASGAGVYTQDLRRTPDPLLLPPDATPLIRADANLRLFGESAPRVTYQRMPVLQLDLVHFDAGPVAASVEAEAVRIAPHGHYFTDTGLDGLAVGDTGWPGPDEGEDDGRLERFPGTARGGTTLAGTRGELTAVTRLSLRPTVSLPFLLPPFVAINPYAGWRQNLYLYDAFANGTAGWFVAGVQATSELARSYPRPGLRHAILPSVEVRHLVPGPGTGAPPRPYDELDLGPRQAMTQAEIELTNRLDSFGGAAALEATLGQDLVLYPELTAEETFASGALRVGPLWTAAGIRWDARERFVSEASVSGALRSGRGDELRAIYLRVGRGGSQRLRAGPDELFAAENRITGLPGISQLGAGATLALSRYASMRYDILWLFTLDIPAPVILGLDRAQRVGALQQTAGFSYRSPCNCWGIGLVGRYKRGQTGPPDVLFSLDLATP